MSDRGGPRRRRRRLRPAQAPVRRQRPRGRNYIPPLLETRAETDHVDSPIVNGRANPLLTRREVIAEDEKKKHEGRIRMSVRACLVALATLAAGAAHAADLSMGNVNPPTHGTSLAAQQFADKVKELTAAKITVTHHHSGALGGEREVAQQIQLGVVDLGPITTAPLSTLVPELSVFQLPYIFRDYEHVFKALDGSDTLTSYYGGVLDKKGFKLVGFIAAGYRGIYGHAPINALDDVKGKKVRVQEDKILVATFKALGMISTPIAFPEVATALQTKVIDFAEGGVNTFYHNKFYDIVKYVADVRHTHQAVAMVMSKASWAKQDAAGQKAIGEAWEHARAYNRKFILDEDRSIQDKVREKGVTITKPDAAPFRQATQGVYEDFYATPAGKDAKKIVEFILAVK
jgi:tripartite ATP-independent transporter DctP family solute receptor